MLGAPLIPVGDEQYKYLLRQKHRLEKDKQALEREISQRPQNFVQLEAKEKRENLQLAGKGLAQKPVSEQIKQIRDKLKEAVKKGIETDDASEVKKMLAAMYDFGISPDAPDLNGDGILKFAIDEVVKKYREEKSGTPGKSILKALVKWNANENNNLSGFYRQISSSDESKYKDSLTGVTKKTKLKNDPTEAKPPNINNRIICNKLFFGLNEGSREIFETELEKFKLLNMNIDFTLKKNLNSQGGELEKLTLFHLAAAQDRENYLKDLLKAPHTGKMFNSLDGDNKTPLHYAVQNNNTDAVKMLIKAEIQQLGYYKPKEGILDDCIARKNFEIAEILLKAGEKPVSFHVFIEKIPDDIHKNDPDDILRKIELLVAFGADEKLIPYAAGLEQDKQYSRDPKAHDAVKKAIEKGLKKKEKNAEIISQREQSAQQIAQTSQLERAYQQTKNEFERAKETEQRRVAQLQQQIEQKTTELQRVEQEIRDLVTADASLPTRIQLNFDDPAPGAANASGRHPIVTGFEAQRNSNELVRTMEKYAVKAYQKENDINQRQKDWEISPGPQTIQFKKKAGTNNDPEKNFSVTKAADANQYTFTARDSGSYKNIGKMAQAMQESPPQDATNPEIIITPGGNAVEDIIQLAKGGLDLTQPNVKVKVGNGYKSVDDYMREKLTGATNEAKLREYNTAKTLGQEKLERRKRFGART